MNTVWLVTTGSYDDYHIIATLSTEAEADKLCDLMGHGSVEEWDIQQQAENVISHQVRLDSAGNSNISIQTTNDRPRAWKDMGGNIWGSGKTEEEALSLARALMEG